MRKPIILLLMACLVILGCSPTNEIKHQTIQKEAQDSSINHTTIEIQCQTVQKEVRGNSMEPLIHDGETVEIIKNLECHPIERNDVVIYNYSGHDTPLIKTVKAVPGDNFSLEKIESRNDWQIMINGQPLKNSAGKIYAYEDIEMLSIYAEDYPTIPAKTYLLLADNPGALDSTKFGLVSRSEIIGVTNVSYSHPQTHK